MAKLIRITESKFADFTINIDGEEEITVSFDQARRLRDCLAKRMPAIRSKVAMKVQHRWRQVKASKYQIRIRLYTDFDGDYLILGSFCGEDVYVGQFVSYLPKCDQLVAVDYFKKCGAKKI